MGEFRIREGYFIHRNVGNPGLGENTLYIVMWGDTGLGKGTLYIVMWGNPGLRKDT